MKSKRRQMGFSMNDTRLEDGMPPSTNAAQPEEADWRKWLRENLFDQAPCTITVLDRDSRIIENNEYFVEIFGDGRGKHCYEAYKGRSEPCEDCMEARAFADGRSHVNEEIGVDKHGREVFYIVNAVPVIAPDGSIPYVVKMCTDVTEIRQRQREYMTLFDRVPCLVAVINRDNRIVRANEVFRSTFGEPNGQRCYELLLNRAEACENCPIRQTFSDGEMHHGKQACVTRDGKEAHYLVTSSPLSRDNPHSPYAVLMAVDVTERDDLKEDLAETAISREVIIEDSIDAIWGTDPEGRITLVNPAAERLLGYAARDIIGRKPPQGMFPPQFAETVSEKKNRCILPEASLRDRDGNEIAVRFSAVAISRAKQLLGYAIFAQDLRQMKQLEREKIEAEKLAAVGETVAGLAHSIKNILNGLEGAMYVFEGGMKKGETERMSKGWEMLERNIGRITSLTRFLLDFTRTRESKIELINPGELVADVVSLYQQAAWDADIELRAQIAENTKPAPMDAQALHTCLANLVSNALDACRASVKPLCRVIVSCRDEGESLVFEVADEGCGMDYEVQRKAFARLFTTKSDAGTGLGLFVTRKIVHEHGGRIEVESRPEQGSRFTLIFPRDKLPKPGEVSGSDSHDNSSKATGAASNAAGNKLKESTK